MSKWFGCHKNERAFKTTPPEFKTEIADLKMNISCGIILTNVINAEPYKLIV